MKARTKKTNEAYLKMFWKAVLVVVLVGFVLTGCGTFEARSRARRESVFYSGVQTDCEYIGISFEKQGEWRGPQRLAGVFFLLDLPFSGVADTLLLPYDLCTETNQPGDKAESSHRGLN